MKKTAILTTWYPSVEPYLNKFIASINNQIDKNFSIIILNNDFKNFEKFKNKFDKKIKLIEIFSKTNNIILNRKKLIESAIKNKFDYLVFCDSDDYFSKNKILLTKKKLKNNDIVINQIVIKKKNKLDETFIKKKVVNLIKKKKFNILNYNVFGLSNTAIKSKYAKTAINKINKNIKIFDWFFWILVEPFKKSVMFESKIKTYYNLHNNNQTFTYQKVDHKKYINLLKIRKNNFFYLKKINKVYLKYYLDEKKYFKYIENKIKLSGNKIKEILEYNLNYKQKLWWEK